MIASMALRAADFQLLIATLSAYCSYRPRAAMAELNTAPIWLRHVPIGRCVTPNPTLS